MSPSASSALLMTFDPMEVAPEYRSPSALKLHEAFNQFLIRWGNRSAQYMHSPMEDMSLLPVEQSISFSDPFEGLLVVRTTREFVTFLASEFKGKDKGGKNTATPQGLFLEMTVLFWHQLFQQVWRLDTRQLKPALFKASIPVDWPDRKPDAACTVFVKYFPLEIRLWTAVSWEEKENWRKPVK